jgi:hypothetical protein
MYAVLFRSLYDEKVTIGDFDFCTDEANLLYSCHSLELPWLDNKKEKSCIPEGTYSVQVVPPTQKIKYEHLHILNVPNRDGIKIHIANYTKDILGCIAPGTYAYDMNNDGIIDVGDSTKAFNQIMALCKKQGYTAKNKKTFKLVICS